MILNEKIFIVTGASSGIGEELSRALALKGAKVVCAARRNDELERVCSSISASGGSALPVQMDIAVLEQCQFLVQKIVEAYGRIDGIVLNLDQMVLGHVESYEIMVDHDVHRMVIMWQYVLETHVSESH